jgi:proteasome lid subunit RPN8/RPN11
MLETLLLASDTEERCGVLLKDGSIVEIENLAEDKENSYDMNPAPIVPLLEADAVAATWHTHPNGDCNLSGEDYKGFLSWPDLEHIIIGRRDGEVIVTRYRIEDGLVLTCD